MRGARLALNAATSRSDDTDWTITVTEPLPDCPSVLAGWTRLATQSDWAAWRPQSKMRGPGITTTPIPPATEPLTTGDEYLVRVNAFLKIRCRVLASPHLSGTTPDDREMVFDATGTALAGLVKARFRYTVFLAEDGTVMARAQERMSAMPLLSPSKQTLENEHRTTLRALNDSFRNPAG